MTKVLELTTSATRSYIATTFHTNRQPHPLLEQDVDKHKVFLSLDSDIWLTLIVIPYRGDYLFVIDILQLFRNGSHQLAFSAGGLSKRYTEEYIRDSSLPLLEPFLDYIEEFPSQSPILIITKSLPDIIEAISSSTRLNIEDRLKLLDWLNLTALINYTFLTLPSNTLIELYENNY